MSTEQFQGRSLRLFLVDGNPNGIITAEIMNWTGHALVGPRSKLPELLKREEVARTGVYFLSGPDTEDGRERVYIGESDDVGRRLRDHARSSSKDFWERTCLITSKDQNITKAHARYLESRLIQIAVQEARAVIANSVNPEGVKLPEADISDMEYFIEQIRLTLPVLGMNFLRPKLSADSVGAGQAIVFEVTSKKYGIQALAREADDEFFVLKDSLAQRRWVGVGSEDAPYARLAARLQATGKIVPETDTLARFAEDVPFKSPSAASAVILGRPDNGRLSWKVKGTKKPYAEWQNEQIDAGA